MKSMTVVIRTDASTEIGTGHVMRCLTLANNLKQQAINVEFICRGTEGNLISLIEGQGYKVYCLNNKEFSEKENLFINNYEQKSNISIEKDYEETIVRLKQFLDSIDLLIVDHYELDMRWEEKVKKYVKKIMVIDDLANRKHSCDLLLDQNLYDVSSKPYKDLVPEYCLTLIGPKYSLLRQDFLKYRIRKNKTLKDLSILVFFGGSDEHNETSKVLHAIKELNLPNVHFHIVVGSSNKNKERIKVICSEMENADYYCQINNMAQLMSKCDLALGAGGSTSWERCCLGLPSVIVSMASNQKDLSLKLSEVGAVKYLGDFNNVDIEIWKRNIKEYLGNESLREEMTRISTSLVDGLGANRVTEIIVKQLIMKKE
ncbi:UDP-2,4-diacetamido-2,4,6-trideoxy-beta-L-altropyranose hydrolase [Metabacillus fastidiosus]|uniref:UDP-2,4-diacetamido-2,4, 6-trideoxy-beta-L-altropyranose hydrolase n=1 Tax=Metabacillus fastidiosus TaxID=1458 RepID=UPI003D2B001B